MQYPDTVVRTVIVSLLSLADIRVFDSEAPPNTPSPYVLILNQENVDFSTKSGHGFIHRITLSAVSVSPFNSGRAVAETLLNQALSLITNDKPGDSPKIDLTTANFLCWMVKGGLAKDLVFKGESESVYQKIVTLEMSIYSLT